MARFVALNFRLGGLRLLAGALVMVAAYSTPLAAQQTMTTAAQTPPASVKVPATNAAPILPPDTLGKYGKILTPGDQVAHPLKLKMPFPDAGEVKIPSQDELTARDKLEQLAMLSDADIRTQLEKWPAFGKMSLRDQGSMLMRIQDFRDYRSNMAKTKAHDMGLLTLTPQQQAHFEKEYWDKRLQMDHDLVNQFAPIFKAREQKLKDDLYREYSAVSQGPIVQAPKPPPNKPAPGAPPSAPPAKPVVSAQATNSTVMATPPVAQAPR